MDYFAYGSNMSEKEMAGEEIHFDKDPRPAKLMSYKLIFNKERTIGPEHGSGAANIAPDPESVVEGVLYKVTSGIEQLRKKEGWKEDRNEAHYTEETVSVVVGGENMVATVYIANPRYVKDGLRPTRKYLNKLLGGSKYLSPRYVEQLESVETMN